MWSDIGQRLLVPLVVLLHKVPDNGIIVHAYFLCSVSFEEQKGCVSVYCDSRFLKSRFLVSPQNSEMRSPVPSRMISSSEYSQYTLSFWANSIRLTSRSGVSTVFSPLLSSKTLFRAKLKGFLRTQSSSIA